MAKKYHEYVAWVKANPMQCCITVKQAIKRFTTDLKTSKSKEFPYKFDEAAADKVIAFAESLTFWEGKWCGQPVKLEPWQAFIIANLYGWKHKSTGLRRFTKAFIFVSRKNGKTALGAVLELFSLLAENGAQVYSIATKVDQARIAFNNVVQFIGRHKTLSKLLSIYHASVVFKQKAGQLKPLSSDAKTADGLGASFCLADEVAAYQDSRLLDVVQSGMYARAEPLMVQITTGNAGLNNPGRWEWERSTRLLSGIGEDPAYFCMLYQLDESDSWKDPTKYIKANPSLGVTMELSKLVAARDEAIAAPYKETEFRTKNCNEWLNASSAWISDKSWQKCIRKIEITEEMLAGAICCGGIDLSKRVDWTVYTLYFYIAALDLYFVRHRFYIPEGQIEIKCRSDSQMVQSWIRLGLVTPTPGDRIDYEYLYSDIESDKAKYKILNLAFDPNLAADLVGRFQEHIDMVEFPQYRKIFSEPAKDWESDVMAKKIIDNSPVMRWMVSCANATNDIYNNLRIEKIEVNKSSKRIDGVITSIMAHSRARAIVAEEARIAAMPKVDPDAYFR